MGSTLSCIHGSSGSQQRAARAPEPARVIAADGSLKELRASCSGPLASVSHVLGSGDDAAAAAFFMCDSDALCYNEPPPALAAGERLRPGQMYFVLPAEMLGRPLSSADMAALAVRATSALGPDNEPQRRRCTGKKKKKQVRVVPVTRHDQGEDRDEQSAFYETLNEHTLGGGSAVFMAPATRSAAEKGTAAASSRKKRPSAVTRMLSIIREDAE